MFELTAPDLYLAQGIRDPGEHYTGHILTHKPDNYTIAFCNQIVVHNFSFNQNFQSTM